MAAAALGAYHSGNSGYTLKSTVIIATSRFLGVPMNDRCREFLATSVGPDRVSRYRHETEHQVREVEEAIGEALLELGYPSGPPG